ncbi:MAG: type II CAAX endopeptidase family protein [Panacibacter sp.]
MQNPKRMSKQTTLQKILHFSLTKMIVGIAVVGGAVVLGEWLSRLLLETTQIANELINSIVGITDCLLALVSYILLFKFYEKRQLKELRLSAFTKNALIGFFAGMILQSLAILVIYLSGDYSIVRVNPFSFLLPAFTVALTAGFVAEILIRGIIFRLMEEKLGTVFALVISALLFAMVHIGSKGATILSILSVAIQAGVLLAAAYVFSRSLWLCIFLHFAWDFAEPGIYGAINPGNTIEKSLFTSKITGPELLTGGQFGPQSSIQSIIFCLVTAILFLWLAKRKNNFITPYWKK